MGNPYSVSRASHGVDFSFMEDALCAKEGHNPSKFFADDERGTEGRLIAMEARSVCVRCPVQSECFTYALEAEEHGIWGGTTRPERLYFRVYGRMPPGQRPRRRPRREVG